MGVLGEGDCRHALVRPPQVLAGRGPVHGGPPEPGGVEHGPPGPPARGPEHVHARAPGRAAAAPALDRHLGRHAGPAAAEQAAAQGGALALAARRGPGPPAGAVVAARGRGLRRGVAPAPVPAAPPAAAPPDAAVAAGGQLRETGPQGGRGARVGGRSALAGRKGGGRQVPEGRQMGAIDLGRQDSAQPVQHVRPRHPLRHPRADLRAPLPQAGAGRALGRGHRPLCGRVLPAREGSAGLCHPAWAALGPGIRVRLGGAPRTVAPRAWRAKAGRRHTSAAGPGA